MFDWKDFLMLKLVRTEKPLTTLSAAPMYLHNVRAWRRVPGMGYGGERQHLGAQIGSDLHLAERRCATGAHVLRSHCASSRLIVNSSHSTTQP